MLIAGCTQDKRIVVYLNGYPHCLAIYTCDVAATNLGCELVTECNVLLEPMIVMLLPLPPPALHLPTTDGFNVLPFIYVIYLNNI